MGAKYNVRDLRKKRTQQHRANCNMGELHHILRCASLRTLPLQRAQKNPYHARDAFLCIYIVFMYIRQCPDNTHVGANCN